jgi:hypothetical protein
MTQAEKLYIQLARSLAAHLHRYARERSPEEQKAISAAHTQLCSLWRREQAGEFE